MEAAKTVHSDAALNYSLLATDIDTDVLRHASNGIYEWQNAEDFPEWIRPRIFQTPSPSRQGDYLIKVKDARAAVRFERHNLIAQEYPFKPTSSTSFSSKRPDLFQSERPKRHIEKLFRTLKPGGTLYLGHSVPAGAQPYVNRYGQNILSKPRVSMKIIKGTVDSKSSNFRVPTQSNTSVTKRPWASSGRIRHHLRRRPPITILLGSCVAVMLYDAALQVKG